MTTLAIVTFTLTFWLGCYLGSRGARNALLLIAASGCITYALTLACTVLHSYASSVVLQRLEVVRWILLLLSVMLLLTAAIYFQSKRTSLHSYVGKIAHPLIQPITMSLLFAGLLMLLMPVSEQIRVLVQLLTGIDLLLPCLALAFIDATDRGEAILPDLLRSFDFSFCIALLFAVQVILVIILVTGPTLPMLALLLAVIASSILLQTFSDQVVSLLDRLAFAQFPQLQKARAELRNTASALPRLNADLDVEHIDDAEFIRLTRRALSHFGDLPHLAASPLTNLPCVQVRLKQNGARGDALGQAIALKELLSESVARLKPQQKGDFGISDEWRYYNALYFPYIAGLKPYSRRYTHAPSDETCRAALDWFRSQVPERTLHNWQNAASRLIAQDLRGHC